tara:strand:- start:5146 stop:6195 length:1050 start_codon:yes stop_codon:yes gene_type:complete
MALAPSTKPFLTGGLRDTSGDSGLQKFIPEIWGMAVKDYMEKNLVVGSIARDLSAMVAGGGDIIRLPKHSELAAESLYGTNDANGLRASGLTFNTQVTTAEGQYTLAVDQSHYAAVSITDIANAQSSYDVMNIYTEKLGYALAKKIEAKLMFDLLNHVTFNINDGTDDGNGNGNNISFTSAGTYDITTTGVAKMIQAIHEADANVEDYTLLLAPATYSSLFKLGDFARYDGVGNSLGSQVPLISGFAGKLGGVNVVVSNNFRNKDNSAYTTSPVYNAANGTTDESDQLAGFLMHKDAVNIAFASGMKSRVQSDYDLASLSTRFVADTVYGTLLTGDNSVNKTIFALKDA